MESAPHARAVPPSHGAIRVSTPFLFVSLGECLTEKSGRVNLGLEGTLVMGATQDNQHPARAARDLAAIVLD